MELVESVTELFIKYLKIIVHGEGGGRYEGLIQREVGGMSVVTN